MDLLLQSGVHAQAGRWRESADAYRGFYESVCESTHTYRYYSISGFTSIFREDQAVATADDLAFLKNGFKNKKLRACDRSVMGFTLGLCLWMCSRRDESVKMYRKVIAMEITAEERTERFQIGPTCTKTAGEIFDTNVKDAQDNLSGLVGGFVHDLGSQRVSSRTVHVPVNLPDELRDFILQAGFHVLGNQCDYCQKEAEKKLKVCQRCRRKYYCDQTCQRAHWKEGRHKTSCREAGQCQPHDVVRLQGLVSKPELNGEVMIIKECATTEGRWIVTSIHAEKNTSGISVNEKNMSLLLTYEEYEHLLTPDCPEL